MGRLIDIDVLFDYFGNDAIDKTTRSNIEYFVSEKGIVKAIPKADYENRLKADMVAMLEDLKQDLIAEANGIAMDCTVFVVKVADIDKVIQQKINELKQESTTKNDLGVDCVARQDVERFIEGFINEYTPEEELEFINLELDGLKHLPPATPQEPKPMVEIDLDYVIKQKYIEREVLDKIRAEIEDLTYYWCEVHPRSVIDDVLTIIDKYKAESEG